MKKTKKDLRYRVTYAMIRKAFTELLAEKPIQSITIVELCERAGINRGTFYKHYENIYDLLEKIEDDMFGEFVEAISPLMNENEAHANQFDITERIFRCLQENSDLCAVTLSDNGDRRFAERFISYGRERMLESYLKIYKDVDKNKLEYYYSFVSAGCIGLLRKWLEDGKHETARELAEMAEGIMLKGVVVLEDANFPKKD